MVVHHAIIRLNQITHCVCDCALATLFVSLSDHQRVQGERFENMNILNLHQRQMKWSAWGGGQFSVKEKRGNDTIADRFASKPDMRLF